MRSLLLFLLVGILPDWALPQAAWGDSIALAYQLYEGGKFANAAAVAENITALPEGKVWQGERANAYSILGLVAMKNGRYRQAISFHQKALKQREKLHGKNSPQAAWSAQNLGICYAELSEYSSALTNFKRAITAHAGDCQPDTVLFLQISIAECLWTDRASAIKQYAKAMDYAVIQPERERCQAKVWVAMGRAFVDWGDFETADSLFDKSLAAAQVSCDTTAESMAVFNIGRMRFAEGNMEEAARFFKLSLQLMRSMAIPNPSELLNIRQSLAYALLQIGDGVAAQAHLDTIKLSLGEAPTSHDAVRVALAEAKSYYYRGQLDHAVDICVDIQTVLDEEQPPLLYSTTLSLLGDAFLAKKDTASLEAAIDYYNEALTSSKKVKNGFTEAECLLRLADAYLEAGNPAKCKLTIESLNKLLNKQLPQADGLRAMSLLLSSKLACEEGKYDSSIQLALNGLQHLGYSANNATGTFTALSLLLIKSKSLKAKAPSIALCSYKEAEAFLGKWISSISANSRADLENTYYEVYEGLIDCLLKTGQVKEAFLVSDKSHAGLLTVNLNVPKVELAQLQHSLGANTAILEYFWGEEQLFCFVVKNDEVSYSSIKISDSLLYNTKRLYDNLSTRSDSMATIDEIRHDAHFVFEKIMRQQYAYLPEHCIIIPSGPLHLIPFESLLTSATSGNIDPKGFPYLLKEKIISYAPSAAFWLVGRQAPMASNVGKCYAFVPVFKDDPAPRKLNVLPNSQSEEIPGISKRCKFKVFEESAALSSTFYEVYPQARILHLSTHAAADPNDRGNSRIYFHYDSLGNSEVRVVDLLKLNSQAEMVVMSACEANLAQVYRGEGAWSLTRAFLHGGCKSVLTTLWKVEDPVAAKLMTDYYGFLKAGKDKAEALSLAKRALLSTLKDSKDSPFYWASFVMVGDERPISLCANRPIWVWGEIAVFLGLAALLVIPRHKWRSFQRNGRTRAAMRFHS